MSTKISGLRSVLTEGHDWTDQGAYPVELRAPHGYLLGRCLCPEASGSENALDTDARSWEMGELLY